MIQWGIPEGDTPPPPPRGGRGGGSILNQFFCIVKKKMIESVCFMLGNNQKQDLKLFLQKPLSQDLPAHHARIQKLSNKS